MIAIAAILGACSAGDGGDNGVADSDPVNNNGFGLSFTYPYDGQQDVARDTQIRVVFRNAFEGDASNALRLQTGRGAGQPTVPITVIQDDNQPNILRIVTDGSLDPNTDYRVVANRRITDGNTFVNEDVGLFSFSTRPLQGTPAGDGSDSMQQGADFEVVETTPGSTNPVTGRTEPFVAFNALRVRFSEPVNPATVTQGSSFTFTGPNGPVDGRLTVLGRNLTFDPTDDLAPGDYTVNLTSDVTSQFGNSLAAFTQSKTVQSAGQTFTENTFVDPTASTLAGLPDSPLSGTPDNVGTIFAQLIGVNDQLARTPDDLNSVKATLAEPGLFKDALPAVIRAGQKVRLSALSLDLNGDIPTPIMSGPIDTYFINDASIYIHANDLRNLPGPTAVRLRLDLGISTLIDVGFSDEAFGVQSLANGLFNQSVLNVQAAGVAVAQPNGDLKISAIGSFPISVNRNEDATTDLALSLILPAGDQREPQPDTSVPFLTAQSPSACLYVFGLQDNTVYNRLFTQRGVAPAALPEALCAGNGAVINSFPIEASPAVVLSEPIDPSSVDPSSVSLMGGGTTVPITTRVEGSSIVLDPVDLLEPDTQYTISLGAGGTLTDLAEGPDERFDNGTDSMGNGVQAINPAGPNQQTLTFRTEPMSEQSDTAPLLGELSPGVPCALEGGDFESGGDNAGKCVGDMDNGTFADLPVFQSPANVKVDAFFSELVEADSIVLANGCLTSGGNANTTTGASVAVQQMDGSGQCVGVVPGQIALANAGDDLTRGFTFRPLNDFVPGTRYWIVVCGTGSQAQNCSGTITDDEGNALNTTPIDGTGSIGVPADGGDDIIMPFVAIAPSINYYTNAFTLPETDTNGSGVYDDANGDGAFQDGDERPQPGNRSLVNLSASLDIDLSDGLPDSVPPELADLISGLSGLLGDGAGALIGDIPLTNPNRDDGAFPSYLSLQRPIALRETLTGGNCNSLSAVTFDDGVTSAVGDIPDQCIQGSLLPGGVNALTSLDIDADVLTDSLVNGLASGLTGLPVDLPIADIPILGPLLSGLAPGLIGTLGDLINGDVGGDLAGGGLGDIIDGAGGLGGLLGGLNGGGDTGAGGDSMGTMAATLSEPTTMEMGPQLTAARMANLQLGQGAGGDGNPLTDNAIGNALQDVVSTATGGAIPDDALDGLVDQITAAGDDNDGLLTALQDAVGAAGGDSLTDNALTGLLTNLTNALAAGGDDGGGGGGLPGLGGLGNVTDILNDLVDGLVDGLTGALDLGDAAQPIRTGRIILRFPNAVNNIGLNGQPTQSGFIVERCTGTFPGGPTYDFEPCFAASLQLVANAPDAQGATVPQQRVTANVVGPVAFEQNGRLAIAVRNTNTLTLNATALGLAPATATINPGDLNFQLVGNAVHGGRAFPSR